MNPQLTEKKISVSSQSPKIFTTVLLGGIMFGSSNFASTVFREGADYCLEHAGGSVRSGSESNIVRGDDMVIQKGRTDTMSHQTNRFLTTSVQVERTLSVIASRSLEVLQTLQDGWQGPNSVGPTADAISDAYAFIEKLASELPEGPVPMIGLDSEGFVVMSWDTGSLAGSLSIFGDGTYAFYVVNDGKANKNGDSRISDPIPTLLIEILAA